jgi:hypothetical protein
MELTQELVRELFDYHEDGHLVWKNDRGSNKLKNTIAGYFDSSRNYFVVKINDRRYQLHRIIYFWHNGVLSKIIDHKDGNPKNNKIENLREANSHQNAWNSSKSKSNTSGYKGVFWHSKMKKWTSSICFHRKLIWLGVFKTPEEAHEAYKNAALELHGEFARFE